MLVQAPQPNSVSKKQKKSLKICFLFEKKLNYQNMGSRGGRDRTLAVKSRGKNHKISFRKKQTFKMLQGLGVGPGSVTERWP